MQLSHLIADSLQMHCHADQLNYLAPFDVNSYLFTLHHDEVCVTVKTAFIYNYFIYIVYADRSEIKMETNSIQRKIKLSSFEVNGQMRTISGNCLP